MRKQFINRVRNKLVLGFILVIVAMLVPVDSYAAKIKDNHYTLWGFEVNNAHKVCARHKLKIKNKQLYVQGVMFKRYIKGIKAKKMYKIPIASNCRFSYEFASAKGRDMFSTNCSYAKIAKYSKKWMNRKGDKDTGEINGADVTIRNGKVVELFLEWAPYDGGD